MELRHPLPRRFVCGELVFEPSGVERRGAFRRLM